MSAKVRSITFTVEFELAMFVDDNVKSYAGAQLEAPTDLVAAIHTATREWAKQLPGLIGNVTVKGVHKE